jgi:hypothetical protein
MSQRCSMWMLQMHKMTLRCLFIGDLHFKAGKLPDHAKLADFIFKQLDAAGHLDLIVTLGDELDRQNASADVRGECVKFLRRLATYADQMIVLVGNHTRKSNAVSIGPDHTLADVTSSETFHMIENPKVLEIRGIRFVALPYIEPSQFQQIIDEHCPELAHIGKDVLLPGNPGPLTFAIGHQEVSGSTLRPGEKSECKAVWPAHWPPLISGHLHERHVLGNVFYVGTPMQHTLNESTDKYIYFGEINAQSSVPGETPVRESWAKHDDQYVSGAVSLREVLVEGVPRTFKHVVSVSDLPSLLNALSQLPDDHHVVHLSWKRGELEGNPHYELLRRLPNVRLHLIAVVADAPAKPVNCTRTFSLVLSELARTDPEAFNLLRFVSQQP